MCPIHGRSKQIRTPPSSGGIDCGIKLNQLRIFEELAVMHRLPNTTSADTVLASNPDIFINGPGDLPVP